jgi:dihydrolipoamide dehydrogenase
MESYDFVVIGAGTAGLRAAKTLKKHGANYLIIEKGKGGTLCADTGCMPSKTLIDIAKNIHIGEKLGELVVGGAQHIFADIPSVLAYVRNLRDKFVESAIEETKEHPVLYGAAKFLDMNTLMVGNEQKIRADKILICTGSSPRMPKAFESIKDRVLTTDTLFEQENLPPSIAVVGLGSIGAEMGQALARLGIEVFAIERTENIAGIADADINIIAQEILQKEMRLYMGVSVTKAERFNSHFRLQAGNKTLEVSGILVSTGRDPNLGGLDLEQLDIPFSEKGLQEVDPQTLQIKGTSIYIAGDANGMRPLQHEAGYEGRIAALHALELLKKKPERNVPLAITFTDPPIAFVGEESEREALVSYISQGRAVMMGEAQGGAKLYASRDGTLKGAELITPAADHLAHFLLIAIQQKLKVSDLLDTPFYHPTLEEGLRGALADIARQAA